ncbi:MAG TPA: hypothetical protein VGX50_16190 [Longimicrobium sp.]|nr:hypothetical protein [Longimicrobium sp.]
MTSRSAPDAESLSCAIAGRYAGRWAQGLARPEGEAPSALWFIDGFAGVDLQRAAMRGASVQPPAVAAIQALPQTARIVLVEEDPGLISRLCEALDGIDAVERIRVTADPASTEPGEIALVEAPFARVAASLASGIGDDPALVRLAPLAARALPWAAVEPLVDLAATDVLLRVPLEDFAKQARFTGPLADLPPHIRRVVEGCSALLSDPRHGWIAAWREAQRAGGIDAAMSAIVARMQALLGGVDEERTAHAVAVEGAGGPVHLLLSTPFAAHALEPAPAEPEPSAAKPKRAGRKAKAPDTPVADETPAVEDTPAALPAAAEPSAALEPASAPVADETPAVEDTPAALPAAAELPATPEPAAAPAPQEEPEVEAPAEVLDLFAGTPEPQPEPRSPRAAARPRKTVEPVAEELGLFDEPEG